MLVKTYGSAVYGVDAQTITIEVNVDGPVGSGLGYFLVGLPDNAVREGYQRIQAAVKNSGLWHILRFLNCLFRRSVVPGSIVLFKITNPAYLFLDKNLRFSKIADKSKP